MDNKYDMTKLSLEGGYDTVIFLIRHGESVGNAYGYFLGHTDKDLSERGYIQAQRTAEFLSYEHIDAVYSSDLMRAHNTVLPHAQMRGLEVVDSVQLREIYAGEWDGMKYTDILAQYGDAFTSGWRASFGTFRIPGGESTQEAAERFFCAVMDIARANKGKKVIIGAHAAVIRAFWGKVSNIPPQELAQASFYPNNASVSVIYYDGENLVPGEYSHDAHLRDLYEDGTVTRA